MTLAFRVVCVDEDGGEEEEGREAHHVGVEFQPRRIALFYAHSLDSYDEVSGALRVILSLLPTCPLIARLTQLLRFKRPTRLPIYIPVQTPRSTGPV